MEKIHRKKALYKTELCLSAQNNGACPYGEKCQFAHSLQELRVLERHPRYKTERCNTFWEKGSCPYGRRCCFIHTLNPIHAHLNPDAVDELAPVASADIEAPPNGSAVNSPMIGKEGAPSPVRINGTQNQNSLPRSTGNALNGSGMNSYNEQTVPALNRPLKPMAHDDIKQSLNQEFESSMANVFESSMQDLNDSIADFTPLKIDPLKKLDKRFNSPSQLTTQFQNLMLHPITSPIEPFDDQTSWAESVGSLSRRMYESPISTSYDRPFNSISLDRPYSTASLDRHHPFMDPISVSLPRNRPMLQNNFGSLERKRVPPPGLEQLSMDKVSSSFNDPMSPLRMNNSYSESPMGFRLANSFTEPSSPLNPTMSRSRRLPDVWKNEEIKQGVTPTASPVYGMGSLPKGEMREFTKGMMSPPASPFRKI